MREFYNLYHIFMRYTSIHKHIKMLYRTTKTHKNQTSVSCLRDVFRPLYLFISLLGLLPYSIQFHNSNSRFQIIQKSIYVNAVCAALYIIVICLFLVMHLKHIYYSFESIPMTEAIMTQMNYITELMNLTIFCFVAYICAYFYRFKYVKILSILASHTDSPNYNSAKVLNGIRYQMNVIGMGWLALTSVSQSCINFTRNDSIWKKLLVLVTFNLPQVIQFTVLTFFYVLVMMIVCILKNIIEQTRVLASDKKIHVYGLTQVEPRQKTLTLRQMEVIYIEISEIRHTINRVFEAPILVTMIQCFHTIVSESHIIYHGVVIQNNMDLHDIINCSVWIVYQFMKIYAIARAGSSLKLKVSKLGRALHNIPTEKHDLRFMMDVQHFSSTISFYGNDFTVYGFFPLDSTLTFKIVASAAMYIIILVQFDKTK